MARYRNLITTSNDTKPAPEQQGEEVEIRHLADEERYEAHLEGQLAAVARYRSEGDRVAFLHTQTMSGFERRGIATKLVEQVLHDFEAEGREVLPLCWFVRDVIARDEQLTSLVPEDERRKFGL